MKDSCDKPLITYQTGPDESYLIGTKEQLLAFANAIISAVNGATPDDFFGQPARVSHFTERILDGKAEIGLNEVVVVDTNKKKDAIFYAMYNS